MSFSSEFEGLNLERAAADHVDAVFLPALASYKRMMVWKGGSLVPADGQPAKKLTVPERIRAFSRLVFPW